MDLWLLSAHLLGFLAASLVVKSIALVCVGSLSKKPKLFFHKIGFLPLGEVSFLMIFY